jgi:hypothetical protein
MYKVKARYYASPDCFGETYVLTSDNYDTDLNLEIGTSVKIIPICSFCGKEIKDKQTCLECKKGIEQWKK